MNLTEYLKNQYLELKRGAQKVKQFIYLVFNYTSDKNKSSAQVVKIGSCVNLKSVIDDFAEIKNARGEIAKLKYVMLAETQKQANETANTWNQTYYNEQRHFYFDKFNKIV